MTRPGTRAASKTAAAARAVNPTAMACFTGTVLGYGRDAVRATTHALNEHGIGVAMLTYRPLPEAHRQAHNFMRHRMDIDEGPPGASGRTGFVRPPDIFKTGVLLEIEGRG